MKKSLQEIVRRTCGRGSGSGDDIFIGGGRSSVFIRGGDGDDIVIGGGANDALSRPSHYDFGDVYVRAVNDGVFEMRRVG